MHTCPHLHMNHVTAKFCATKRAAARYFTQGLWNREIFRFAIASPDLPHVFRIDNHVHNGHDLLKCQYITRFMCTGGSNLPRMVRQVALAFHQFLQQLLLLLEQAPFTRGSLLFNYRHCPIKSWRQLQTSLIAHMLYLILSPPPPRPLPKGNISGNTRAKGTLGRLTCGRIEGTLAKL